MALHKQRQVIMCLCYGVFKSSHSFNLSQGRSVLNEASGIKERWCKALIVPTDPKQILELTKSRVLL